MSRQWNEVPQAEGQETIRVIAGDYLDTLERMIAEAKPRNDPTLAVALSVDALDLLVSEVRRLRRLRDFVLGHVAGVAPASALADALVGVDLSDIASRAERS